MTAAYLEYLSFLRLDPAQEKYSSHFRAVNSGAMLSFCNRVFVPDAIRPEDCKTLQDYYGELPFTIWIGESNKAGCLAAENMGLNFRVSYPLMAADLTLIAACLMDEKITVKQVMQHHDILEGWASLAAEAFAISLPDFKKFISYLLSTQQALQMRFYVGYYQGVPAATAMLIVRNGVADVHWVGTLAGYRQRGLGYAVSCFPLHAVKSQVSTAVLFASAMGKPGYEKLGFSVVENCSVYDLKSSRD